MIDPKTVQILARRLFDEHKARQPFAPLTDALAKDDLASAYAVQQSLQRLFQGDGRGAIAGYKVALTSPAMQEMCGIDRPLVGAILANTVHRTPARLSAASFQHLGLECEMAVSLAHDLKPSGAPYDREKVASAVADCRPAFELIEDRGADYSQLDAASLTADNAWNGGIVLGATSGDWRALDMEGAATRLTLNGEAAGEGRTGDAMGHPFDTVAWLANFFAERRQTLPFGAILMTGSTITTKFPVAGDHARFEIEGLGHVELTLEP